MKIASGKISLRKSIAVDIHIHRIEKNKTPEPSWVQRPSENALFEAIILCVNEDGWRVAARPDHSTYTHKRVGKGANREKIKTINSHRNREKPNWNWMQKKKELKRELYGELLAWASCSYASENMLCSAIIAPPSTLVYLLLENSRVRWRNGIL